MQADHQTQRSWRIEVRAKARNFNFKLNATKLSPTWNWKFCKLSLLLKLHSFFLRLNLHSSTQPHQETLKSKLRRILDKIRSKSTKKAPNRQKPEAKSSLKYPKQELIYSASLFVAILALVNRKGEIFVCLGILLLLKKFESGKGSKLLIFSIAIMALSCSVVFDFTNYYMKYIEGYASKFLRQPWKFIASLIWNTL